MTDTESIQTPDRCILDKGFQRFLRLGCLRPVANDHRESLACGDGVELSMELLALVGKDCCVGFHNHGTVMSTLKATSSEPSGKWPARPCFLGVHLDISWEY